MYVRTKIPSNRKGIMVQLVEGERHDDSVKQHVIQHIGTAHNDEDLARLDRAGEYEKARLLEAQQPGLFLTK